MDEQPKCNQPTSESQRNPRLSFDQVKQWGGNVARNIGVIVALSIPTTFAVTGLASAENLNPGQNTTTEVKDIEKVKGDFGKEKRDLSENKTEQVFSWEQFKKYIIANKGNIEDVNFFMDRTRSNLSYDVNVHTKSGKTTRIRFSQPVSYADPNIQRFFKERNILQRVTTPSSEEDVFETPKKPERKAFSWSQFKDYVVANKNNIKEVRLVRETSSDPNRHIAIDAYIYLKTGEVVTVNFTELVGIFHPSVSEFFNDNHIFRSFVLEGETPPLKY